MAPISLSVILSHLETAAIAHPLRKRRGAIGSGGHSGGVSETVLPTGLPGWIIVTVVAGSILVLILLLCIISCLLAPGRRIYIYDWVKNVKVEPPVGKRAMCEEKDPSACTDETPRRAEMDASSAEGTGS